ncbi:hypothetical protein Glove_157g9 [Diversispora epigaea]|uniref:Serine-threonine/tyrosine-protein kinase catalytic domain-containing protein n=1 Tax=Diversispora epigaea TaxID=1348612 RepID=A0A397IWH3_9GLOM|nr:hypothetical protein Glove_157g9 [Diversispora epigaea]
MLASKSFHSNEEHYHSSIVRYYLLISKSVNIAYEIVTGGFSPYYDIPHDMALQIWITTKNSQNIIIIMRCWDARVTHRPLFEELYYELDNIIPA